MIMQRGEHLTIEGIQKIVNIRASLNKGLTTVLKTAFPNCIPFSILPVPLNNTKLHPQWIAGFTYGDGCFKFSIRESKLYKAVSPVVILFILAQHIRDKLLLKSFIDFFDCGHTYSYLNYIEFKCPNDNHSKIIMKRFYLFVINILSLVWKHKISRIGKKWRKWINQRNI